MLGKWKRQEVVQILAIHIRPTEMVGNDDWVDPIGESFQALQVGTIQRSVEPIDRETPWSATE